MCSCLNISSSNGREVKECLGWGHFGETWPQILIGPFLNWSIYIITAARNRRSGFYVNCISCQFVSWAQCARIYLLIFEWTRSKEPKDPRTFIHTHLIKLSYPKMVPSWGEPSFFKMSLGATEGFFSYCLPTWHLLLLEDSGINSVGLPYYIEEFYVLEDICAEMTDSTWWF